ncbi:MAG TPA: hypothetical protein VGI20_00250 [Rhizomicrobium sp.]
MRGCITALAAVLIDPILAGPCLAQGGSSIGNGVAPRFGSSGPVENQVRAGTVTKVDSALINFGCHWKTGNSIFWVTANTHFRSGDSDGSFADQVELTP